VELNRFRTRRANLWPYLESEVFIIDTRGQKQLNQNMDYEQSGGVTERLRTTIRITVSLK
jgi:hypothetical protein